MQAPRILRGKSALCRRKSKLQRWPRAFLPLPSGERVGVRGELAGLVADAREKALPLHLPPPLGEGWGEGMHFMRESVRAPRPASSYNPHPSPLPEGEGEIQASASREGREIQWLCRRESDPAAISSGFPPSPLWGEGLGEGRLSLRPMRRGKSLPSSPPSPSRGGLGSGHAFDASKRAGTTSRFFLQPSPPPSPRGRGSKAGDHSHKAVSLICRGPTPAPPQRGREKDKARESRD